MRISAANLSHPDEAKRNSLWRLGARVPRGLALLALCLVVYLPGLRSLPAVDRDESRFAQASRQMFEAVALPASQREPSLHGGGMVIPRVQGKDRLNKPPLIYWLQAASATAFTGGDPLRDAIWMYRVPSVLAAIVAVLATWRLGVGMFGARVGTLAAAMLAVCPVVAWEAHQARADMVLLACTTSAMWALWNVADRGLRGERPSRRVAIAFWIAISLGILTKGPITPMVAGLAVLGVCIVSRRWRWLLALLPLAGIVIVIAAVGPWIYAVGERIGWESYTRLVLDETLGRSVGAKEGHWGPPGYHLALLVVLFWPGSLLTGWAVVRAWKDVRKSFPLTLAVVPHAASSVARASGLCATAPIARTGETPVPPEPTSSPPRRDAQFALLYCLAWVLPAWLVFELVGTKLPHYTLPLYPALALLSARLVLAQDAATMPRLARCGVWLWLVAGLGLALAPLALAMALVPPGTDSLGPVVPPMLTLVIGLLVASRMLSERRIEAAQRALIGFAGCWLIWLFGSLPQIGSLWTTRQLGRALGQPLPRLATCGYDEDSLTFLARGRLERLAPAEGGAWLAAHGDGVLIAPAGDAISRARLLDRVRGFNYSKGRWADVGLFIAESPSASTP